MSLRSVVQDSLLLPVYVPTILLAFAAGMLAPIMPLYARSFDISYGMVGIVLASQGIGNLVGDIPAGILLGRIGHKWSMIGGIALMGGAMLAMSWAQSVSELILYGFASGVGNAMWNLSRHAYLTSTIPIHVRGRATATFGGINRIGTFLGPVVGGTLATIYSLRFPFIVFAMVSVVALIVSALFTVDPEGEEVQHRGGLRGHTDHLLGVFLEHFRILSTAGVGQLCGQLIRSGRQIIVPLFAADTLGLGVDDIGLIVTLSAAIDMSMFYPAGLIMDRLGRKKASVPSFFIQALGMAMIPMTTGFFGLLAATMVVGFGNGLGSGSMLTLGSDLAPRESMGEFLGIWRLVGDSGRTGAPMVVGAVADLVGLAPATFVIAGFGLAAAAVLGLLVPETLKREQGLHRT